MEAERLDWRARFAGSTLRSIARTRGCNDAELVLELGPSGLSASRWLPAADRRDPVPGLTDDVQHPILAADNQTVLALRDDNGSEVGHVWSYPVGTGPAVDLTPRLDTYALRGIATARVGSAIVLAIADERGYALAHVDPNAPAPAVRELYRSEHEAWNSLLSADGALASIDTTEHNPGIRRFELTVIDVAGGEHVATLSDGPREPVVGVRFSPLLGDPRILATTERTGFARPLVWHPYSHERIDVVAEALTGDLIALDWSDDGERLLLVHVDAGVHRVLEYELPTRRLTALAHPDGAYFAPDVAAPLPRIWASHYGPGREIRLLRQRFDVPLELLRVARGCNRTRAWPNRAPADSAELSTSVSVRSADGTPVQLWTAAPRDRGGPLPCVLNLHGGPNLVTVDGYCPEGLAWLDNGFAYASLNYRGSVTFGREFREGFWGCVGEPELEDIAAAVGWLTDSGIATRDGIFVTGASYGGFLTLLSLGKRPELFAGGFAFVAMADWALAFEDMHPSLRSAWRHFLRGTPECDPQLFRRRSPIAYVPNVRAPVLLCQATNDTRTPARQASEYARRLTEAGGDVLLTWFDGGHETTSMTSMCDQHELMLELAHRALRGERWDSHGSQGSRGVR